MRAQHRARTEKVPRSDIVTVRTIGGMTLLVFTVNKISVIGVVIK